MAQASAKFDADILVVDDDDLLRELVAEWLQGVGYGVRTAPHCRAALQALEEAPAALIVSDMYMPGACGVEAIAQLKRRAPSTPLIALSGYFNSGVNLSPRQALAAGAARALAKPVRRVDFLRAVRELIGPPAAEAATSTAGCSPQSA
jgi:CheY-like chemotaxis protein